MEYKYITDNNLENIQTYMYSEFGGYEFLDAYWKSRIDYMSCTNNLNMNHCTRVEIDKLKEQLTHGEYNRSRCLLDEYVKRFEVSKRVYSEYNDTWKATANASCKQYDLYISLSECCLCAYEITGCTKYLSCALKIDDTLISLKDKLTQFEKNECARIISGELKAYEAIAAKLEVKS